MTTQNLCNEGAATSRNISLFQFCDASSDKTPPNRLCDNQIVFLFAVPALNVALFLLWTNYTCLRRIRSDQKGHLYACILNKQTNFINKGVVFVYPRGISDGEKKRHGGVPPKNWLQWLIKANIQLTNLVLCLHYMQKMHACRIFFNHYSF